MRTVLAEIETERNRQDDKWGPQNHSNAHWLAILTEEVGEAAECVCKSEIPPTDPDELLEYRSALRQELVQIAAVAVAWIESYDRELGK